MLYLLKHRIFPSPHGTVPADAAYTTGYNLVTMHSLKGLDLHVTCSNHLPTLKVLTYHTPSRDVFDLYRRSGLNASLY